MRMYRRPWISWPRRFLVCRRWQQRLFETFWSWMWQTLRLWREASPTAWPMRRMTCSPPRWMWEPSSTTGPRWSSRYRFASSNISWIGSITIWPISWWKMCKNCASKVRHIRCMSRWSLYTGLRFWRSRSYWTKRLPSINTGWPIAGPASNLRPIIKMASTKIFCRLPF